MINKDEEIKKEHKCKPDNYVDCKICGRDMLPDYVNKDEEIKSEVKKWSWEFYKLLGYRITDNIEEDKAVNKFMEDVIKKTRQQERERILELINRFQSGKKQIKEKIIWQINFKKDLIKEL